MLTPACSRPTNIRCCTLANTLGSCAHTSGIQKLDARCSDEKTSSDCEPSQPRAYRAVPGVPLPLLLPALQLPQRLPQPGEHERTRDAAHGSASYSRDKY
jgi:hypothetical protein